MRTPFEALTRNRLAFPAGAVPGFDPSHPAAIAGPTLLSAVAGAGSMIDLITGVRGTITGTPSFGMHSATGPYFDVATNAIVSFSNKSTVAFPVTTIAAIISFPVNTAYGGIIATSTAGATGAYLSTTGGDGLKMGSFAVEASNTAAGLTFAVNVPYFVIGSTSAGVTNFYIRNLNTGQEYFTSANGLTLGASNGTMGFGCIQGLAGTVRISAGAAIASFMTQAEMQAWGTDPWSFWYPDRGDNWNAAPASLATAGGGQWRGPAIQQRNPLAYPAGVLPGFDPSHVAHVPSTSTTLCAVAHAGSFRDLLSGVTAIQGGAAAPTPVINGALGPCVSYDTTKQHVFAASGSPGQITFGVIFKVNSITGGVYQSIMSDNSGANAFEINPTGGFECYFTGNITNGMPQAIAGHAYLFVGSFKANVLFNTALVDLTTGQSFIASSNAVGFALGTGKTSIFIGNGNSGGNQPSECSIAAVAYTNKLMSIAEVQAWAADPWSFWYPPPNENYIAITAAAGGAPDQPFRLADHILKQSGDWTPENIPPFQRRLVQGLRVDNPTFARPVDRVLKQISDWVPENPPQSPNRKVPQGFILGQPSYRIVDRILQQTSDWGYEIIPPAQKRLVQGLRVDSPVPRYPPSAGLVIASWPAGYELPPAQAPKLTQGAIPAQPRAHLHQPGIAQSWETPDVVQPKKVNVTPGITVSAPTPFQRGWHPVVAVSWSEPDWIQTKRNFIPTDGPFIPPVVVVVPTGGGGLDYRDVLLERMRRRAKLKPQDPTPADLQAQLDALMAQYQNDTSLPFPLDEALLQMQADEDDMIQALMMSF